MTAELTHEEVIQAEMGFLNFSIFSFKEPNVRHQIRRNLRELIPLSKDLKSTLDDIRDNNIKKDKDGKPKRKKATRGYNGQDYEEEGDWDWVEGGQEASELEQRAFLDQTMEVCVYPIKDEWLTPAWRYVVNLEISPQTIREEYFPSYNDTRWIEYAIEFEEELEKEPE